MRKRALILLFLGKEGLGANELGTSGVRLAWGELVCGVLLCDDDEFGDVRFRSFANDFSTWS